MKNILIGALLATLAAKASAWGFASGTVENLYVNTYGNYLETTLNGGFCFKLAGTSSFFKVSFADSGEKKDNLKLAQSLVLTAKLTGRSVKATFVDWGTDPTCRMNGNAYPAKWLENVELLD